MGWKSRIKSAYDGFMSSEEPDAPESNSNFEPEASFFLWSSFDGEKNEGELGSIKHYIPDYLALSERAWQSYLTNEVTHDVIKKFCTWVVGSGLKLNADPNQIVLASEGIILSDDEEDKFSNLTEERYAIYTNSRMSAHSKQRTFQRLAKEAFKATLLSGDVLVIDRVKNKNLTRQIVEGTRVRTPIDPKHRTEVEGRGNRLINGIELSKSNEHIAYYISVGIGDSKRIEAKNKRGITVAYLVYGQTYRPGDQRGIPLVTAILETLKKMDRYKEAAVGSAEEKAKVPYVIEHGVASTGENPFDLKVSQNLGVEQKVSADGSVSQVKKVISDSYDKTVVNLPRDAKLTTVKGNDSEIQFEPFYKMLLRLVCATVEIPMEVALSWYDSNYSASRAALKDWEHTLKQTRADFSEQYYKPHYQHWLDLEVLKNKINAKGYLMARQQKNFMAVEAYTAALFTGTNIPHIDPLKEVLAERAKLGNDQIPLTTAQASTDAVNGGNYKSNVNQLKRELKEIEDMLGDTELSANTITAIANMIREEMKADTHA